METSLRRLLERGTAHQAALGAPGRQDLTHADLRTLVDRTLSTLNGMGIGRTDRLALVLPNGPEMATCFMACASGVTSAPLNPAYRADEFEFYLNDLHAKALIVEQSSSSPAIAVAQKQGVRIIDLVAGPEQAAGHFTLTPRDGKPTGSAAAQGLALQTHCRRAGGGRAQNIHVPRRGSRPYPGAQCTGGLGR